MAVCSGSLMEGRENAKRRPPSRWAKPAWALALFRIGCSIGYKSGEMINRIALASLSLSTVMWTNFCSVQHVETNKYRVLVISQESKPTFNVSQHSLRRSNCAICSTISPCVTRLKEYIARRQDLVAICTSFKPCDGVLRGGRTSKYLKTGDIQLPLQFCLLHCSRLFCCWLSDLIANTVLHTSRHSDEAFIATMTLGILSARHRLPNAFSHSEARLTLLHHACIH